jgi:hypothetical protein
VVPAPVPVGSPITIRSATSPSMPMTVQPRAIEFPITILFASGPRWTTNVPSASPQTPAELRLWTVVLKANAAKHPYIQQCLSSIACLYTGLLDPRDHHVKYSRAYQYQIAASSSFRDSLFTIDETNWAATLIFAISMIMFQFASQQVSEDPFDYMDTLHILRMSADVASSVGPFLAKSKMWAFILRRNNEKALQPPNSHVWIALHLLEEAVALSALGKREVLVNAFQSLKRWVGLCNASPGTWREYIQFPSMVSMDYLRLLAEQDDVALLIFIYWCTVMRLGLARWFFSEWLPRAVATAQTKLTETWSDLLEWPNSVMNC